LVSCLRQDNLICLRKRIPRSSFQINDKYYPILQPTEKWIFNTSLSSETIKNKRWISTHIMDWEGSVLFFTHLRASCSKFHRTISGNPQCSLELLRIYFWDCHWSGTPWMQNKGLSSVKVKQIFPGRIILDSES
jgi:hypothetical protein